MMTAADVDLAIEFIMSWLKERDPAEYEYWRAKAARVESAAEDQAVEVKLEAPVLQ